MLSRRRNPALRINKSSSVKVPSHRTKKGGESPPLPCHESAPAKPSYLEIRLITIPSCFNGMKPMYFNVAVSQTMMSEPEGPV